MHQADTGWTKREIDEKNHEISRMLLRVGLFEKIDYYLNHIPSDGTYEAVVTYTSPIMGKVQTSYFGTMEEAESYIAELFPEEGEDAGWNH